MKKTVRVLQFITPSGFYGAERWVLALANNLERGEVICDLAVTREGPGQDLTLAELYPKEQGQQVHFLDVRGRFDFGAVSQLCQVIRDRRIDIIHTHGYKSDILGLLAARRTGIKALSTPHGFPGKTGLKLGLFIQMGLFALRRFDCVAPLSDELMTDMARFRVPADKTHFIRNGVDLTEIDATLKELSAIEAPSVDIRVIGFIGQLIPRKGVADLLDIFEELFRNDPRNRLQLLGDGRQRQELEQIAAGMESSHAIEFLGFRGDRLELLSRFDLFVMTSSLEGIPRCLMEAMAVGVPVVAYDIPGVDQLVRHEETGLLAPFGDKSALADCCQRLLNEPDLAARVVANARQLVEQTYSGRRMAQEYQALFKAMLGQEQTRALVMQQDKVE